MFPHNLFNVKRSKGGEIPATSSDNQMKHKFKIFYFLLGQAIT